MVDRPHVALVTNTGWSMVRYRGELISALLERGWQVSAIADFSDQDLAHLRRLRVAPVRLELAAASQNPFKDLGYFSRLVRTLRSLQPDLVHNFSVKPVIYGSLAAKLVGIEAIVNSITGGGMLRAGERGGLQRVLRLLYRLALRGGPVVIFQNPDDLDLFVGAGLIERARTAYVAGSGVDTAALAPDWAIPPAGRTCFVMASRMLWSKGVADFVEAARIIKPRHPSASFVLFGGSTEDYGSKNPDFIPKAWLEDLNREGVVAWQGFTDPALVERAMRSAGAVVLPSRAEGMPRTLIEAAAAGVPIITTDTPGCHDTVSPGRSGSVCPPHAPERIAGDMIELIEHPERWDAMGREARNLAVTMFDSRLIVDQMFAVYGRASASASFAFEPRQA